ncbi:hypothetical protein [Methylobacterium segetis]|uniref:hypothetical protein n=1 Tax=Methylobacterium segetis TaxID=2488750 RepID=UPI0010510988|nr:hypothetical protein [Methylobacterium segetis]
MPLPEWLTQLLDVSRRSKRIADKDFERDQAAVDAKLAPYWGHHYPERPPDPRIIDPSRLKALRGRLLDKYHYRWRQVEAADEIVDALFEPLIESKGARMALTTQVIFLNDEGHSPDPRQRPQPEEFKKYYYITVHSLRLGAFLTSYEEAVRLLNNVLPDWGFTAQVTREEVRVRLERGDEQLDWVTGGSIATLIVAALLDLLADRPTEAKPWRSL